MKPIPNRRDLETGIITMMILAKLFLLVLYMEILRYGKIDSKTRMIAEVELGCFYTW
jgi:hypothetical protein